MTGTSINLGQVTWHTRTVVHIAVKIGASETITFLTRTEVLSDKLNNLSEASCLEATVSLHMLSNALRLLWVWCYHHWSVLSLEALTASPSVSRMLPRRCAALLASEVSPAALEKFFSCLNLGLHCPDDEEKCDHSGPLSFLCQKLPSFFGSYVFDVDPIGSDESVIRSSSGSVYVGFARL